MDTLIAMLTRDVRDLRSGMTAQLRLLIDEQRKQGELLSKQGEEIKDIKTTLAEILTFVKK